MPAAPARPLASCARASPRCGAARAGNCSTRTATLRPIPSTAQPSCGRPSARMPATLASSSASALVPPRTNTTSFGHLIRACSPATSQTASAASSGSSGGGSRSSSDISSALPAGADQRRPWRPRPALCSAAVTSVPCGAPANASSRARSFVESVRRRCTRGRPSVPGAFIARGRQRRRAAPAAARRCRARRPRRRRSAHARAAPRS